MATFRFTAGPWNIHEGNETFGPGHRKSIPLEEKMKKYAEIGLAGMQFHDDDAVPTTITSSFLLLLGLTRRISDLRLVHFSANGPSGILEINLSAILKLL